MDDKKKNLQKEETKVSITEGSDVINDFEDLHKKGTAKEEQVEKTSDTKSTEDSVQGTEVTQITNEEKETETAQEKKIEKTSDTKQEKSDETEQSENADKTTGKDKTTDLSKDSEEENKKTDAVEQKEKADSKDNPTPKEDSNDKENSVKEKSQKETDTSSAITQSKRLAEAKEAAVSLKENQTETVTAPKKSKYRKALWIILASFFSIILVAYFAGFVYFSGHFYQDATINGIRVSNMNKASATQALDTFYQDYVLTIKTIEEKELSIDGKDISMQISLHDEFNSCLKQQRAYLWFIYMFEHHEFEVGADASWDDSALTGIYNDMKILDKKIMVAPKDAYVGVEDGKFIIVKEILGTTIDQDIFKSAIKDSLFSVQSVLTMKEEGCYNLPKVYDTDETLQKELDAKNEFGKNEIKLKLDDLTLEPGMELYNEVLEKTGDSYQVSEKLVEKYVHTLAKKYDTLGKDRTFTTSFNDKKLKINGTAFGYEMNQDETEKALYKALTADKAATVEVIFDHKGYTLKGENDIGDTYIEVNLSEQKVIAYKNGKKIAEGDCVSGKEATGHGTCLGLYEIQDKLSPTVLRGEKKPVTKKVTKKNKKGKKVKVEKTTYEYEYESPVTFWLQFNGGYGLHDAAGWRGSYGGSIYYYSGSHGCVNLSYSLAETLYKNFELKDPVVVYFWDNENRK